MDKEKKDREGKGLTNKEKISYLANGNYTTREKELIYSSMLGKEDKKYSNLKLISNGLDINQYLDFKQQEFKNADDPNSNIVTKTLSGTKEADLKNYLKNSDFNAMERVYLYGGDYQLSQTQAQNLQNYMNQLGLTHEEQTQIVKEGLKKSNYVEYENGTWKWKQGVNRGW